MESKPLSPTIQHVVAQLLRPLFRLLLRQGMSFGAFEEVARRTFVDVAHNEFNIPGKKPSISRTSILSGLSRKEVQRLTATPLLHDAEAPERHNRAARVISGWIRDPAFLDAKGQPRALKAQGAHSFEALVKRYSGDVPARALRDELIRVGAIQPSEDGGAELVVRAYVPKESTDDMLGFLGSDVADLIATIDHNIAHGTHDPKYQRKVLYKNMPADVIPAFRKLSATQSQALLEKLDRWLADHANANPHEEALPAEAPKVRVGLGIYYIEDHLEPTSPARTTP